MSRSWVTWRVVLAAILLWVADRAWDLYDGLSAAALWLQMHRRASRGLVRLSLLAALSGASLASGYAYGIRGTPARPGVEARVERPAAPVPAADAWAAAAEGCIRAGGTYWQGTEAGVVVARCRPFLQLEPGPKVATRGAGR